MDQILSAFGQIPLAGIVFGAGLGLFVGGLLLLIFRPQATPAATPAAPVAPEPRPEPARRPAATKSSGELSIEVEEDGSGRARFRISNIGSDPVQVLGWYAQWGTLGQKGAELLLRSHDSLPRLLHARQELEFSVEVEPQRRHVLSRLGVIDSNRNRWSADPTEVLAIGNPLKAMPDEDDEPAGDDSLGGSDGAIEFELPENEK